MSKTATTSITTKSSSSTEEETSPSRLQSLRRRFRRHRVDGVLIPKLLAYADIAAATTTTATSSSSKSKAATGRDQRTLKCKQQLTSSSSASNKLHEVPSSEPHPHEQEQEQDTASTTDITIGKFQGRYEPDPVVPQSVILAIGIFVFVLAAIWPPLILLFAYCASKLIPYSFRVNDDASTRRQLFAEFAQEDDLPEEFKTVPSHIQLRESYWVNARGMTLCTTTMLPKHMPIKAVVCFCHGYTDTVSFMKQVEYQRLVNSGIAFCAIEYEGHGRSDGPMGLIPDWELLIDDVSSYFREVALQRFAGKPIFLMGESMGGAVAYSVYNRMPNIFRGVVFVCPMCKIADDMLPPQWIIDLLARLIGPSGRTTSFLGYLPIAPAKANIGDVAHSIQAKADMYYRSPLCFGRNPRLATSRELIRVTQHISNSLADFSASFLVLHGLSDRVTDPLLSQALYDESCSTDKSIQLLPGMFHGLTSTEPDENIDRVFHEAIQWILARC